MDNPSEEIVHRTLNHYSLISFKDAYWSLSTTEREEFHRQWLNGLCAAAQKVDIFQSTESGIDLIVWSALTADDKQDTAKFFEKYSRANNPFRHLIDLKDSCGDSPVHLSIQKRAPNRRLIHLQKHGNLTW